MLDIVYARQAALDRGRELAVVQIEIGAEFDRESHSELLYKLSDVVVGGLVFDIITGFLSGTVWRVVVDRACSEYISVISGIP